MTVNVPETLIVTGPTFQQQNASAVLVQPTGGVNDQSPISLGQVAASVGAGGSVLYEASTNTSSFTPNVSKVSGAQDMTLDLTGTLAAAGTLTTPAAVVWLAGLPNIAIGQGFNLRIINNSGGAFAWTVTGGTGVTVNGTATIAQHTFRDFYVTVTGISTITMQNVGSGTN